MRNLDEFDSYIPSKWPVLSTKQPWAQLILEKVKDIEIRSWTTTYRGPIWIHTGLKVDEYATSRFKRTGLFLGGLVGFAYLSGIIPFSASSWEDWRERHLDNGDFDEKLAKYGWILKNATPLPRPIKAKGEIGLYLLNEDTVKKVEQFCDIFQGFGECKEKMT